MYGISTKQGALSKRILQSRMKHFLCKIIVWGRKILLLCRAIKSQHDYEHLYADVTIGFEDVNITVRETELVVEFTVSVLRGFLARAVEVTFTTSNGEAIGLYTII